MKKIQIVSFRQQSQQNYADNSVHIAVERRNYAKEFHQSFMLLSHHSIMNRTSDQSETGQLC